MAIQSSKFSRRLRQAVLVGALATLAGCATRPIGPSVTIMPAPNKPFDVFVADDAQCRQFADRQSGGTAAAERANEETAKGALLGTLAGAALGAVGTARHGGEGAAAGAAIGAVAGTAIGAGGANRSVAMIQRDYDRAYQQCMYSRGNQVPGYQMIQDRQPSGSKVPPPPPPGPPPPPPPGVNR